MSKHARTNQLRNHTLRWRCASSALRLAIAAATSLGLTAGAVALWSAAPANAAETHQNCVVTDDQGNILSVTPNCSETSTYQGGQSSDPNSVNPCTGDTGTFTMYFRQNTFHVNVDGAGDLWATGTESGTVSFVPDDPSAPGGTGSFATWFNFNDNNSNGNTTFTFDAEVHLSNGQIVGDHEVGHMNFSSTGAVTLSFDKPTLTCA